MTWLNVNSRARTCKLQDEGLKRKRVVVVVVVVVVAVVVV